MEERKTVSFKKEEFAIKEYIKKSIGKGKISRVRIEYTPLGEKIIISTNKPGLVIGRRGERVDELTKVLKTKFRFENPHVEIDEIIEPEFDAQIMADEIAMGLEKLGPIKFKVITYKTLQKIIRGGALGVEIKLSGKLPGARAKRWKFAYGYLKKTGDGSKIVDKAQARAETKPGTVGIKVSILSPHSKLTDKIVVDDKLVEKLKANLERIDKKPEEKVKKKTRKKSKEEK